MKNKIYYIFITLFLVVSSAPFWGMLFYANQDTHEKRVLAGIKDVRGISSLNQFIVDNHAFRDKLSDICMSVYVNFFKESPIPEQVVFGKDGWQYLGNSYRNIYNASLGIIPITQSTIEYSCNNINEIKQFCDSLGIDFYFAIAPNKASIYPEHLALTPNKLPRLKSGVMRDLKSNYGIETIDLFQLLENEKKNTTLYYKYDSHWNDYGALLATQKIVDHISEKHNIKCIQEDDYLIEKQIRNTEKDREFDLSIMLNMQVSDTYFQVTPKEEVIIQDTIVKKIRETVTQTYAVNKSKPNNTRAFIIRDSFFIAMYPFFISSVNEASLFTYFNKENIIEEIKRVGKPDFLILIPAERNI
ncbi:hypothetical protein LJC00_03100 [Dysgonomonas sp. OttesenSCG-928-M03]|nr:hypothetical protein [Dysgonomonas sp. OttesenSCG-928-M03]